MQYQPANLLGGFYKDSSKPWSAQDTLNWIPEVAQAPGTRTEAKLRTVPGMRPFVEIGPNPIRGSHNCEGKLFVVSGNRLYQISNTGVAIPIGTIPGTGLVSMSHNQRSGGNELTVVNGSAGYVYNTRTLAFGRISDPAFPGSIAVDYLDQYMLHVEPFGRYWFHSELADATQFSSLDRYESEASPDKIVTLKTNNLEVVVFNETTTEFFDNTGAANNTFQNKRAVIDVGAAGRFSVAKIDRSLIWLANDGVFYYLEGYSARPISTPPIEQAISGFNWAAAIATVYESEGHKVAYFTFPGGLTFGYDVVTQLWHRRGSFGMDRWRVNTLTNWNRKNIVGDFQNGRLYELDWKYPLEGDQPLVRSRTSGVTHANQNRIFVPYVEAIIGVGQEPVSAVAFPEQPEGPSISGDAPNGAVGVDYENFVYTHSVGDKPLVSSKVTSGALPPGFTYTGATHTLSQTGATLAGRYTFTIRDTDENGLWAEVTDTIEIAPAWEWMEDFGGELYGAACDDAGRYIACGYTGSTAELWRNGPDLGEWEAIDNVPTELLQPRSMAWGRVGGIGYWVVSAGANVIVSTNRVNWSLVPASSAGAILVTLHTGTGFLRLGQGGASDHCTSPSSGWVTGNIGVSQDVRSGVSNPDVPGTVVAFCSSGAIRRTQDNGVTWFGVTLVDDPHPALEFSSLGSIWRGSEILAYKYILNTVVCVYRSTDNGVTFTATDYVIDGGTFNLGPVSEVDGFVMAPVGPFTAPAFSKIWKTPNGLPPFAQIPLIAPAAPAGGVIYSIVDGGKGNAIAIGRYTENTSFSYRYVYGEP